MNYKKAFEFAKLSGSEAVVIHFGFAFEEETSTIVKYDPREEEFSITRKGKFFNGPMYRTKDAVGAHNLFHIISNLDTNSYHEEIRQLVTIFGRNPRKTITDLGFLIIRNKVLLERLKKDKHLQTVLNADVEFINYGV